MADKRRIRQGIGWLQRIRTWQLVLLLILVGVIAATFLRLNNIGMIERRTAVLNADKQGDPEVIRARLFDLQRYSSAHMNASSGTLYLEAQYDRDTQNSIAAASSRDAGDNINVQADQVCRAQHGGYSQAYVQCFAAELAKFPSGVNAPDKANLPSPSLYRHDFSSPLWSADFAGFSVAICLFIVLIIVVRLIGILVLRGLLHRHYSSV
ncbi:MAG: hypothetical protein V4678_04260 [Patescibacteria group bacterium]